MNENAPKCWTCHSSTRLVRSPTLSCRSPIPCTGSPISLRVAHHTVSWPQGQTMYYYSWAVAQQALASQAIIIIMHLAIVQQDLYPRLVIMHSVLDTYYGDRLYTIHSSSFSRTIPSSSFYSTLPVTIVSRLPQICLKLIPFSSTNSYISFSSIPFPRIDSKSQLLCHILSKHHAYLPWQQNHKKDRVLTSETSRKWLSVHSSTVPVERLLSSVAQWPGSGSPISSELPFSLGFSQFQRRRWCLCLHRWSRCQGKETTIYQLTSPCTFLHSLHLSSVHSLVCTKRLPSLTPNYLIPDGLSLLPDLPLTAINLLTNCSQTTAKHCLFWLSNSGCQLFILASRQARTVSPIPKLSHPSLLPFCPCISPSRSPILLSFGRSSSTLGH